MLHRLRNADRSCLIKFTDAEFNAAQIVSCDGRLKRRMTKAKVFKQSCSGSVKPTGVSSMCKQTSWSTGQRLVEKVSNTSWCWCVYTHASSTDIGWSANRRRSHDSSSSETTSVLSRSMFSAYLLDLDLETTSRSCERMLTASLRTSVLQTTPARAVFVCKRHRRNSLLHTSWIALFKTFAR